MKTMLLQTTGEIAVQPDEANITVRIDCIDKNIKNSKDCIAEKSENLNKVLKKFDINPKDILTTSIDQSKEYNWLNNSNVFVGYKSSITTLLTIRNLKVLEDLYSELLLNENINVENLSYSHSKLDSINNLAYQKALDNANILADQLLKKMTEKEKEIFRIGNIDLPSEQSEYLDKNEVKSVKKNKSTIDINSGTVFVTRTLNVEFKIK
jgi:uncharacterized protein YggE